MKLEAGGWIRKMGVVVAVAIFSACSVSEGPKPNLVNVPQPQTSLGEVFIGPFVDERPEVVEMGPSYIGTVRGGFGNVLARLHIDKPVSERVAETVGNVLRNAEYHTNPAPATLRIQYSKGWKITGASSPGSFPIVVGRIKTYNTGHNGSGFGDSRIIEIDLEICILDSKSGVAVQCDNIKGDAGDQGTMAGPGVDYSKVSVIMGSWLTRFTEDSMKNYVAKTPIIDLWKDRQTKKTLGQPNQIAAQQSPSHTEDRLVKLQQLREKNLITEEEYRQMRGDILKGL